RHYLEWPLAAEVAPAAPCRVAGVHVDGRTSKPLDRRQPACVIRMTMGHDDVPNVSRFPPQRFHHPDNFPSTLREATIDQRQLAAIDIDKESVHRAETN